MTTAAESRKMRAYRWRDALSMYLGIQTGLPLARKPEPGKRLSVALRDGLERSDIQGIPGWTVLAKDEVSRDMSTSLDLAAASAEKDGSDRYAVIWTRHERGISEAYVLTSLAVLGDVLAAEQEARA